MSAENLSVIILAGGESRRMGEDKKFVHLKGKYFLEIALEKACKIGSEIIISVGKGEKEKVGKYAGKYGAKVVEDRESFRGPLLGVINAIVYAKNRYIALLPVDAPLASEEFYEKIAEEIKSGALDGVALKLEKIEPLFGVYEKNALLNACKKAEMAKNKGLKEALKFMKIKFITRNDIEKMNLNLISFASVNTKEELERINESKF